MLSQDIGIEICKASNFAELKENEKYLEHVIFEPVLDEIVEIRVNYVDHN